MHAYVKMWVDCSSPPIPIQYNHLVQGAIYGSLPEDMAARLHDQGYAIGKRSFKMFSFSRLLGKYNVDRNAGTISFQGDVQLVISSPEMRFFLSLINNLLTKKYFRVGESSFRIEEVRFDEQLAEGEMITVRTLSPVVVYSTLLRPEGGKYTCYFQPGEGEFERLVTSNLRKKYEAFYRRQPPDGEISARPLDRPRLHVTYYKSTVIKGYACRLRLTGPKELLQMALDAGLGSKNAQGYGCVERVAGRNRLK